MAELRDRVVTVNVRDPQGRYVARSLVQLCVNGEPFAQAYTGEGPVTIQATDTGELRVNIVAGEFEQSFPVDEKLTPINVVVPDRRPVPEDSRLSQVRRGAGMIRKIALGGVTALGVVIVGLFLFRFAASLLDPHHRMGKDYVGYITPEPNSKPIAIVFIHGIFGNNKDTWSGGEVDFTQLLARDPDVNGRADIYEFGYRSPYTGQAQTITQTSVQLAEYLRHDAVFEHHQQVVFVAHSMGGLILRKYLLDHREQVQDKVAMMFFYATPSNGSELATIAQKFSNNPQVRGLVPLDANEALQSIQSGWFSAKTLARKPSYCAYETLKTDNVAVVVTQTSASALCTEEPQPITADHIGIVKPTSNRDESYIVLIDALKETVLLPTPPPATPAGPILGGGQGTAKPEQRAPGSTAKPVPEKPVPDENKNRDQVEAAAVKRFVNENCTRDLFIDQNSWLDRKTAYEQLSVVKQSSEALGNSLSIGSPFREPLHRISVLLTRTRSDVGLFPTGSTSARAELTRDGTSSVCRVRTEVGTAVSALEKSSQSGNSCSKEMLCDLPTILREWDQAHKPLPISQTAAATSLAKTLRKEDAGRVGLERVHHWRVWMDQIPPELAGKIVSVEYTLTPGFSDPIPSTDPSIGYASWKAYPCPAIKNASFDARFTDGSVLHASFNFCGLQDGTAPQH